MENIQSDDNLSVQLVCEYGHLDVVQYLCEMFGLTVEDIRSDYNWALQLACGNGHFHVIRYLCEHS